MSTPEQLKAKFRTGMVPTQTDFANLIDSALAVPTPQQVGADPAGTAAGLVSSHTLSAASALQPNGNLRISASGVPYLKEPTTGLWYPLQLVIQDGVLSLTVNQDLGTANPQ